MSSNQKPNYLFEVSWEVCNKVGGIHTVLVTKSQNMIRQYEGQYISIGPDVWRSTEANPEFEEDPNLLPHWRREAAAAGLHIRVGWWSAPGNPIAILVDFTPFIDQKDQILSRFWEEYNLDSLTGQWDYIEPVLFGYAAGKVIENFIDYHTSPQDRVVVHYHEWLSGAGLLYLKMNRPGMGHVFTCHSTVLGRTMAGNGEDLYKEMENVDPEAKSQELQIRAKHSLEYISAREADVFTTVSAITARECEFLLGKKPDLVTPNGFDMDIVKNISPTERNDEVRSRLVSITEAVLGIDMDQDPVLIATSGRYEFRSKGLDVLIDALGELNKDPDYDTPTVVFFLIPGEQHGPKSRVLINLKGNGDQRRAPASQPSRYLTHYLVNSDDDPIIQKLKQVGLHNQPDQKIKVIFIPAYLDGADGIVNMPYYETLTGVDQTVFPSYYEPWGYTPLESLALQIPTITTDYAGFGNWVEEHYKKDHPSISIIPWSSQPGNEVVNKIAEEIRRINHIDDNGHEEIRRNAISVASIALWDQQIQYYNEAYALAVRQIEERPAETSDVLTGSPSDYYVPVEPQVNQPVWTRMIVRGSLPESLSPLQILSKNLWWSWNAEARSLFESIDPDLWEEVNENPVEMLQKVSYDRLNKVKDAPDFRDKMHNTLFAFDLYLKDKKDDRQENPIAYFSMEYGLHASLQLYSGGLGVLAGDYLKQASDDNVHMVAIGLLYRFGYFSQRITAGGQQMAAYDHQNFNISAAVPVRDDNGKWISVSVAFPGRTVKARIWKVAVGRTDLYLLDADFEENEEQDRTLTYHLYGGDLEHRLKQEILLGIGGIRTLNALGIEPSMYHLNEGHAAFVGVERLHQLIRKYNLSYFQAREVVRASSLFTTHTPVPAGHDVFPENLMRGYLGYMADKLKIDWSHFMFLGGGTKDSEGHSFSMSILASRLSNEINGVSMLHGKISQQMFADIYPGYFPEENHISYVTNGVHYPTWTDDAWRSLLEEQDNPGWPDFDRVHTMQDEEIWSIRQKLRQRLYKIILKRAKIKAALEYESPSYLLEVQRQFNPDALIVGFARRFATYKRAGLLFRDQDRLDLIVNHPERPVVFIFAGKAHPHDTEGQQLIKDIVHLSKMPRFIGKIIFLQNYDMDLAKYMVSGVDVWLNTPTRPLEASGTSGQKVVMNGGLHFSVLDGWWVEGYRPGAGWALSIDRTYLDQDLQNELDVDNIYSLFEGEITHTFFDRDAEGIPRRWIDFIRKSMTEVAPQFTSHRMIQDYIRKFYDPLRESSKSFREDRFAKARYLASWKKRMMKAWKLLQVKEYEVIDVGQDEIVTGNEYSRRLVLDLGAIPPENIGVELVVSEERDGIRHIIYHINYELLSVEGQIATYELTYTPLVPGTFDISTRIFLTHEDLSHRSRLPLVRWL